MIGLDYTVDGVVSNTKLKGLLPNARNLYLSPDMLALMNDEFISVIVPLIMKEKQEYLVAAYDEAIAAGQTSFFIDHRAVGLKLRDCVLVDSGGQELPLDRYEPEDLKNGLQVGGLRPGFYVDNDKINLLPSDGSFSQYTFRQRICRRPNKLVAKASAGQITAINTGTKVVTLDRMPSAFTTSLTYDLIKGTPSFRCRAEAQAITTKSGFDLTFTEDLPEDLEVGDWVAETGYSPIPQVPCEIHPLLGQRTVMKIMEGMKDAKGLELATASYDRMAGEFAGLVTPRVDGSPQKLVSRRGIASYRRFGRRGGW